MLTFSEYLFQIYSFPKSDYGIRWALFITGQQIVSKYIQSLRILCDLRIKNR